MSVAALSPVVVRDSLVTLPLARHINTTASRNIVAHDQARVKVLRSRSQGAAGVISNLRKGPDGVPIQESFDVYTVDVQVGTPPTTYTLIVDTGSSNTWVGAGTPYEQTNSSVDTGDDVVVFYGSGLFEGEEFLDTVSVGSLTIHNQSIGDAEFAFGFQGFDGILGLGPTDLTEGTTSDGNAVPTFLDNAFAKGLVQEKTLGISFEPAIGNGELTIGGTNRLKFFGELNFIPFTSTSPASDYVGIDQSITYGIGRGATTIMSSTAGIVDTGTTLILIPSDALATYQNITGAVLDEDTGFLSITKEQYDNLESLFFHIGKNTFEITPNAQIWPRALNTAIGGQAGSIYLILGDSGVDTGSGLDFINGYAFLQRFYHAVDYLGERAGFAFTEYTYATSN
ncbi:aspartic peptidase A1 [Dichomitus squalens]|uniref:Aspartic peptidase A1 n=1 Tax=Dichomitus squalens TaxID=114155 RepID=A0A4Q9PNZ9_9APHY|nr:aspartic peptidase A1 [Dichomitus squalens]